jgi:hypothetical protein
MGDTMPTHKDLVDLARVCLRQAGVSEDSDAAATLFRLALDYSRRATELDSTKNQEHRAIAR